MITQEKVLRAIREAKEKAKERKFLESVDITINFRNVDFKKPENRIEVEVQLPRGRGKSIKICAFVDKALAAELKKTNIVDKIVTKEEIQAMGKKEAKRLAKEFDYFIAEPSVMPLVGRVLGPILGPRKKMPKVVPPVLDRVKAVVKVLRSTVKVTNKKGKPLPTVHAPIGVRTMSDEELAENAMAVIRAVASKVGGEQFIKSIYVKTTMGPAVKVVG